MAVSTEPATLAGELMSTIAGLRRVVRRRVRQAVPGPALPIAQVELLIVVEAEPGIGVAATAKTLGLAGNSASALVNALVDAGLLRRDTDPTDRRAARLHLTGQARRHLERWRGVRGDLVGTALHRLDPADRTALAGAVPALRRLLDELGSVP